MRNRYGKRVPILIQAIICRSNEKIFRRNMAGKGGGGEGEPKDVTISYHEASRGSPGSISPPQYNKMRLKSFQFV